MRRILSAALLPLAACSPQPSNDSTAAGGDRMGIPSPTPATVETPVSVPEPAAAPSPSPSATVEPVQPAAPGTPGGLDDDRTPVSEAPFAEESAQGAANVVQRYYALLESRRYTQAWRLWGDGGRASGMSAAAFAKSFDKYSEYHAQIGAPGRIEPGAGQRYVTVPVQVYGRLKDGSRTFNTRGNVTLHRTVVDGASAEQRSWRISASDIKPRPGEATPKPSPSPSATIDNRSRAPYRCIDGSRLVANFDPDNRRVTIIAGGQSRVLRQERVTSGIRYASGGYAFAGKGDTLTYTRPGQTPLPCTVNRR